VRFDIAGKSLWYGTPDAPAPGGTVTAGAGHAADGVTVTVGVQPLSASNRVELHYRVNSGAPAKIPAVLFRTDVRAGAQYFSARLPNLRAGDKVEYGAVCACGNLEIPQPGPPHYFPSSFHVVAPGSAPETRAAHSSGPVASQHRAAAGAAHHGGAPAARGTNGAQHPAVHPTAGGTPPHQRGSSGHGSHTVEGIVSSPGRGPLAGVLVEIVDKNPGPHLLLATATTDDSGHYRANYTPSANKSEPDICVRVFAGQTLLGSSPVRYGAGPRETLGVTIRANAQGLPSEYETLTAALTKGHAGKLADLKESGERDDITYLANKTGWDARGIVFAAVADQFASNKNGALWSPFYYALFRAGFSMDPDALYAATATSVTGAWKQAIQSGIIPKALDGSIDAAAQSFLSLSAAHTLEAKPAVGLSSLKELLQVTLGNDPRRQQAFAALHVSHKDDPASFWSDIERSFGPDIAKRLQLDGQLAHLTLNNAPLLAALHRAQGRPPIAAVDDLAWRGFYHADKWMPLIGSAIPKEIAGDTIDHRRTKYAEYLAAQVRLASPTTVVADMVATGVFTLSTAATAADKDGILAFFREHNRRFPLGGEPVERYLAHNLSATYSPGVIAEIKRLQRVYQITPNDQAFAALLRHGLDSAYAVTRYDPVGFARAFGEDLGGKDVANQVHAKARVVAAAALQIATSRLAARGAHARDAALRPSTNGPSRQGPLVTSPTLEQLFGSMDFCDCPECRSILSPAAYLVDLLNFIDYPPAGKRNPQTVLLQRRPDLQHLPLTCENTNVVLKYIDLVNETLEYFVANRLTLAGYQGHTTDGSITSEELLASPQFVQDSAYTALKSAPFPSPLPFNRPLELLRLLFQAIGLPLHAVMTALRADDFGDRGSAAYDWGDILMERVGLSRAEHRLLTDGSLTLSQVYSFPATETASPAAPHAPLHAANPEALNQAVHALHQTPNPDPSHNSQHGPASPAAAAHQPLRTRSLQTPNPDQSHNVQNLPAHRASFDLSRQTPQGPVPGKGGVAIAELSNFQEYCRRVGVSYEDMAAILRTRFINSNTGIAARVEALGVSFEVIHALKAGMISDADFLQILPAGLDPVAYGAPSSARKHDYGPIVAWVKDDDNYAKMMGLIIITKTADSDDTCSAASLRLCYANPDPNHHDLRDIDFLRLLRFIRLWRKLGLSIHQTDAVISALHPDAVPLDRADEAADLKRLDAGFSVLLTRIGSLLHVLELLSLSPERDLPSLLACWAPIGADGRTSLYARMFLSPSLLRQDPVFAEDPTGNVLREPAVLFEHEPALRSALHLTGTEFSLIARALGFSTATPLTLENVSAIYRRGWLARALRISVVEFLALVHSTRIDPFEPLDFENPTPGNKEGDRPIAPRRPPPMVRFIRLVQALRDASVKPTQALYLFWNIDISGKATPGDAVVNGLARSLRADAATVEGQFALVDDPDGSIAKNLMALAYGSDATDFYFSLLDGSLTASVPYSQPEPTLPDAVVDAGRGRLAYDDLRKLLIYGGVLDATSLTAMTSAAANNEQLSNALAALSTANHRLVDPFFANNPSLQPLYAGYVASTDPAPIKRKALLAAFLPDLKHRRKEELALATVTTAAGSDQSFAAALLRDAAVLASAAEPTTPALVDFTAVGDPGLTARFFLSNDLNRRADLTVNAAPVLFYEPGTANALPAGGDGGPIAGTWTGFVEVPKSGFYDIAVATDAGAMVTLEVNGEAITMGKGAQGWSNQTPLSLNTGTLAPIKLTVTGLKDRLAVRWTTTGITWQVIPAASLYSAVFLDRLRTSHIRFLKAASLGAALNLTANEVAYLAANPNLRVGGRGWLSGMVTNGVPGIPLRSALTGVLNAALDFSRLKSALSPEDESLVAVLQDPDAALPGGGGATAALDFVRLEAAVSDDGSAPAVPLDRDGTPDAEGSALLALTRWDRASLSALLTHFFGDPAPAHLTNLENFRRVYDAYDIVTRCGISAAALIKATTNEPSASDANNLRAAVRAQYADTDWLTLVKPINDKMRALQRDALVAFALHHLGDHPDTRSINTPERLFEYLFMDVEMAPCMETSRIRLALSSIQLFIEHSLHSLVPEVDPSHISAEQWKSRKQFRLAQANLQTWLTPEKWLDPELRQDQSPFFKEAMGQLLQGDITEDAARAAFLGYLAKLQEVAKLEPCGICCVPADPGAGNAVTHVIARTAGSKRKYFYRRRELDSWLPWEEIKLNIEDNPVVPFLWNERLLLFWLQILKQAPSADASSDDESAPPPKPEELKFDEIIHWSKAKWAEWHASVDRYNAYEKAHETKPDPTKLTDARLGDLHHTAKATVGDPAVKIQAVLCWSEYRDGQWLPANTSDVDTPTILGSFPPHGPSAFDRSRLCLRMAVQPDGHLLIHLALDTELEAPGTGFRLYNTHSAPIAIAGIPAEKLHNGTGRRHAYHAGATLRVEYKGGAAFTRDILGTPLPGRVVEPQPGSQDAWKAPFLYEDGHSVFYVTTEEFHEPPATLGRFGFAHPSGVGHSGTTHHFPPLRAPHHPFRTHQTESATSMVRYDGALIGPNGRVTTAPHHMGARR
jgi:hypothetical protein